MEIMFFLIAPVLLVCFIFTPLLRERGGIAYLLLPMIRATLAAVAAWACSRTAAPAL